VQKLQICRVKLYENNNRVTMIDCWKVFWVLKTATLRETTHSSTLSRPCIGSKRT